MTASPECEDEQVLIEDQEALAPEARRAVAGTGGVRVTVRALVAGSLFAAVVLCGVAWRSPSSAPAGLRQAIEASALERGTSRGWLTWGAAAEEARAQAALAKADQATLAPVATEDNRILVDGDDRILVDGQEVHFDCNAGREDWEKGWSVWKKKWCCTQTNGKFGCSKHLTGSCHLKNVRWSLLDRLEHSNILASLNDGISLALNEIANTPFNQLADASDMTPVFVVVTLQEYPDQADNTVVHFSIEAKEESQTHRLFTRLTKEHVQPVLLDFVRNHVSGISEVATQSIDVTHCLIDSQAMKLPCSCANGVADKLTCPAQGGEKCASCFPGYMMEHEHCHLLECTCDMKRGFAATGTSCPSMHFKFCAKCEQGFHLMRNIDTNEVSCEPNECFCDDGLPTVGRACAMDKAQICASCREGYHHNDLGLCQPNECYCTHGEKLPLGDPRCKIHLSESCNECYDFFHRGQDDVCELNTCSCSGGVAAIGDNGIGCRETGAESCVDCNADLFLRSDGKCGEKECLCQNGVPQVGDGCFTHKGNICHGCLLGFKLTKEHQCIPDEEFFVDNCLCINGKPTRKDACRKTAATDISAYNKGNQVITMYGQKFHECSVMDIDKTHNLYQLFCKEDGTVKPVNVEPWRVMNLVEHECASCSTGYRIDLQTKMCKANVCRCAKGVPAVGKTCLMDGLEVCESCKTGHHHEFSNDVVSGTLIVKCVENVCYCDHGMPATAVAPWHHENLYCHSNNAAVCQTCFSGYGLTHRHLCEFKQCKCENGFGASGPACYKNGAEDCSACNENYHLFTGSVDDVEEDAAFMGIRRCRTNDALTSDPFDCELNLEKSFLGWSQLKKFWCCKNNNIGCVQSATQEEACTGQRLDERSCKDIGCCSFIAGQCSPKDRNEEMCMKGWALITLNGTTSKTKPNPLYPYGLCLDAVQPYSRFGRTQVSPCNAHDRKMLWGYFAESQQLKNMLGQCAVMDSETNPSELRLIMCDATSADQIFTFAAVPSPGTSSQRRLAVGGGIGSFQTKAGSCMTAHTDDKGMTKSALGSMDSVDLKVVFSPCDATPGQRFILPPSAYVQIGSAISPDALSAQGLGSFKVGDKIEADTQGKGKWEQGIVEKINADGTYMVFVGGFPYNNLKESRLSLAKGFRPTWKVIYTDGAGKKLDARVRRHAADGKYEVLLTESKEIKLGVPAEQLGQINSFVAGQKVHANLHGTWFPGIVEKQQETGLYDVRLDVDHALVKGIATEHLSAAEGFKAGSKVWFKDPNAKAAGWDPKWVIVRHVVPGGYEISNHEGQKRMVSDPKLLSMKEGSSIDPGATVDVQQGGGNKPRQATVVRRYSDGSYAVMYANTKVEMMIDDPKKISSEVAVPTTTTTTAKPRPFFFLR